MCYVYILKSLVNSRFYIGSTNDLEGRLKEHNLGKTQSIRFTRPYELVFSQTFKSLAQAREIEYKLKQFKSRRILEQIIKDQRINLGS